MNIYYYTFKIWKTFLSVFKENIVVSGKLVHRGVCGVLVSMALSGSIRWGLCWRTWNSSSWACGFRRECISWRRVRLIIIWLMKAKSAWRRGKTFVVSVWGKPLWPFGALSLKDGGVFFRCAAAGVAGENLHYCFLMSWSLANFAAKIADHWFR